MKYFEKYTSNTCAGTSNQSYFTNGNGTGRIHYKVFSGGRYGYSFLFTNIIDSTFADGTHSHANLVCDEWEITAARVGICKKFEYKEQFNDNNDMEFKNLTFGGDLSKNVMPGEYFYTDEIELDAKKDEYIVIEIDFKGKMIPCHPECIIPAYIKNNNVWEHSTEIPFPSMVGCNRKINKRVAFIGDSITQGIGTDVNSYEHWNARLSKMLGDKNSYWNLGIGFGRGADAATDSTWLYKAKQCDTVVVCFGVNDILQNYTEETLKVNLEKIVDYLKKADKKIILQTIPPFDYNEEKTKIWLAVCKFIQNELSKKVDFVFDVVPVLSVGGDTPQAAKYGGHPNGEGCAKWAEALYENIKEIL